MSISSKFSVAVHILLLVGTATKPLTSAFIAGSVNTNPVVIRRIIGDLKKARILDSSQGKVGYDLLIDPSHINLLDIYKAVSGSDVENLFSMHENPNLACPVGASIQVLLESILTGAQEAMEKVLSDVTLQKLIDTM